MKIWYDRKSKDPTYFIQMGIRNGKKTTTKNVARIGKHSELLKITDDPLAYAKEQVKKYNEEYKNKNCVSLEIKVDFAEKIKATGDTASHSTLLNIGYFFLQQFYHDLKIDSFFESITLFHPHIFIANVASIPLWIKTNLRRVAQRQSTVGLNSPSFFICCSFLWVKTELSKKPPTYNPGFSVSCSLFNK